MRAKKSTLIEPSHPSAEVFVRANGISTDRAGIPVLIAWMLEEVALRSGWKLGSCIGTEGELIEQFGVSRDKLREAIRVMEARGSMQMKRGCVGGLRLISPSIDEITAVLATYLQASGFSQAELSDTILVANPILDTIHGDTLIIPLFRDMAAAFSVRVVPCNKHLGRAGTIAAQLAQCPWPIPEHGVRLGDEVELCEKLNCTRPALREALRLLDDLAMIKVKCGRGGGVSLVRPSPDGTVRRAFGLIAAMHLTLHGLLPSQWALNLIRLRLATRRLSAMDTQTRQRHCDAISSEVEKTSNSLRWHVLQQNLEQIADNKLISVLTECLLCYFARLGYTNEQYQEIDEALRHPGNMLVQALRNGEFAEAERIQLAIHDQISSFFHCATIPPPAANLLTC